MYIKYVMKYVSLLLYHDIKPILVFDGRNLPSKVRQCRNTSFSTETPPGRYREQATGVESGEQTEGGGSDEGGQGEGS